MELIQNFTIFLVKRKSRIDSSYFLHNVFTSIGYFGSIKNVIDEMSKAKLLKHEGYFDNTSGLIKNITLTKEGDNKFSEINIADLIEQMESVFGKSDLLSGIKSDMVSN